MHIPKKPKFRKRNKSTLEQINNNINFDREKSKTNSRKTETQVVCISCKKKFILPFKPRKPEVYCDDCFKNNKTQSRKKTNKFYYTKQ